MDLLQNETNRASVLEAVSIFEESDELVDADVAFKLDGAMSAWGLRPQASEAELQARVKLDEARVGVPSPYPDIKRCSDELDAAMADWSEKFEKIGELPSGTETLPAKIQMLSEELTILLRARRALEELKTHRAKVKAYFVDKSLDWNITRFGEKLAQRVKPNETLNPVTQTALEEAEASLVRRESTLNKAEDATQEALESYSTIHTNILALLETYRAEKAEIGQRAIDATIADTVARVTSEGTPDDGESN
jgi:hypothetical protein